MSIGESCAEDDAHYLSQCFIDKYELTRILDLNNNSSIILGRTGAGKTAVLEKIKTDSNLKVRNLDPSTLFFQHVSNSKTFDFFLALGANLDVIFALLWKHVLLVESLKLYFESQNAFERKLNVFSQEAKSLQKYLKEWGNKFWEDTEISVQEVISNIENNLSLKAGISIDETKLGAEGAGKYTLQEKTVIRNNILSAVNTPLASLLHKAIEDLNHVTENKNSSFYILIDELDDNWMVSDFKFRLIRALLSTIRKFRKIRRLKVLVAMRNDLYERTIAETADAGFQSEKHKGLIEELTWDKEELFQLVDKRIAKLFKWQYTKSSVTFSDMFPAKFRNIDTFQYLIDRTLMRPRDLIELINHILKRAAGGSLKFGNEKIQISAKKISEAENAYSIERKQAVVDEWANIHPQLNLYIDLLTSLKENFDFENQSINEKIDDLAINLSEDTGIEPKDRAHQAAKKFLDHDTAHHKNKVKQEVFSILYKVGVISIKLTKNSGYQSSTTNKVVLSPETISLSTKFKIHPMFWRALGITPNIGK